MASRRRIRWALLILTPVILLCVCSGYALAGSSGLFPFPPAPVVFDVPILTSFTGVQFADDFRSQERSLALGWTFGSSEAVERSWSGGSLDVTIRKMNGGAACYVNRLVKDFGAEIEAEAEDKPGIEYGIAFRYSLGFGRASHYLFRVTTDGKYHLLKIIGDQIAYKSPVSLTSTQYARTGSSKNRLGVLAQGSTISLYINGHLVRTITDGSLSSGSVAMFATSGPNEQARISFHRMTLYTIEKAKSELGRQ